MKYKSVEKYLSKNKENKKKNPLYKFLTRFFICLLILLACLIYIKQDKTASSKLYNFLYKNNISLSSLNNWYQKNFGDILPFQSITKDKEQQVFNETLKYKSTSIYKDGAKLEVEENYLVPVLESGIVVFEGTKDDYGKTIIIEQVDGLDVWYGNLKNVNVKLYDYCQKGEFLGEANKNLYMVFQKEGKYLDYKNYLK